MHLSHPLRVTLRQIIVDCDNVHTLPCKCVQVSRERGHKGLTFSCPHLRDTPLMQDDTSDDLHSVVAHADASERGLTHNGVCLGKDVVQRLAFA